MHRELGLVGVAQPPKENGASITVRMEPGAIVKGRLVNVHGQPRAGVKLAVSFRPKDSVDKWRAYLPKHLDTDRDGQFRIGALLPSYEFRLSDDKGKAVFGGLKSGQTKDLGDLEMKEKKKYTKKVVFHGLPGHY